MTFLTKPNELKSPTTIKGLILGDTNNGKTTLALSAPDPVLIDFENGLSRVSKQWQSISMQCKNYENFLNFLVSKEINQFKTIVIDPLGEMADQIKAYVISKDPKLAKDGRKLFPAIGNEFKNVWTILKDKGLSILFVSHTEEILKNDVESLKIRCEGSFIKNFLPTQMDFVAILRRKDYNKKTQRFLDFQKNETFTFAKRWTGLEDIIEVPTNTIENKFLTDVIWKNWEKKNQEEEGANQNYDLLIKELKTKINNIKDIDTLNLYYCSIYNQHEELWTSHSIEKAFLNDKVKELDCSFDKKVGEFKIKINYLSNTDIGHFYLEKTGETCASKTINEVYEWATKQPEIVVHAEAEGKLTFKINKKEEIKIKEVKEKVKND